MDAHARAAEVLNPEERTSILPCQDAAGPELPSERNMISSPSASPYKTRSGRTVTKPDRLMYHKPASFFFFPMGRMSYIY